MKKLLPYAIAIGLSLTTPSTAPAYVGDGGLTTERECQAQQDQSLEKMRKNLGYAAIFGLGTVFGGALVTVFELYQSRRLSR